MTDLYQINEILQQGEKKSIPNIPDKAYKSDVDHLYSINLFIKAVEKSIVQTQEAMEMLKKSKSSFEADFDSRTLEDANIIVAFSEKVDMVINIISEFSKAVSICYDDSPEILELFKYLNELFTHISIKLNLFSIKRKKIYGEEAVQLLNKALQIFHNMKESMEGLAKQSSPDNNLTADNDNV